MTTSPDNPTEINGAQTSGTPAHVNHEHHTGDEWQEFRGEARHHTVEVLRLILILLQDSVILIAGFAVEYIAEHFLHSQQPFFQLAISISSAMFLLLYGVMVTVHVVNYVRKQFSATAASLFGRYLPWGLASAGVIAAVIAFNKPAREQLQATTHQRPIRFSLNMSADDSRYMDQNPALAVSPDGTRLVYGKVGENGLGMLYMRNLDELDEYPVPGSTRATHAFFSPDGQWVGFSADGFIRKAPVTGGAVITICSVYGFRGGTWGRDGTIIFGGFAGSVVGAGVAPVGGLLKVSADGGSPEQLTELQPGEASHSYPQILPDGETVIFTVSRGVLTGQDELVAMNLRSGARKTVIPDAVAASYVHTGHLLFYRGSSLMAVPFDLDGITVQGTPAQVLQFVAMPGLSRGPRYSVSEEGTIIYIEADSQKGRRKLAWISRTGIEQPINAPIRDYFAPRLSPDGKRLAVEVIGTKTDVWVFDFARETLERLTLDGNNVRPIWSRDGSSIAYSATRNDGKNIFQKPAGGGGREVQLTLTGDDQPSDWTPDDKGLVYTLHGGDVWWTQMGTDRQAKPLLTESFYTGGARLSPDGRWLAYGSDQSGKMEIYVQPFPGLERRWLVSVDGGSEPVWSATGKSLFYRSGNKMMAVEIDARQEFSAGKPTVLFEKDFPLGSGSRAGYDVAPNDRFLILNEERSTIQLSKIVVVKGWFEELKQKVPVQ